MNIINPSYPPPPCTPTPRDVAEVLYEIVHHSAGALTETPLDIDAQHRAQGWCGIGYTYVITPDGTIYSGRALTEVPAAAQDMNTDSVDICLIGNFQSDDAGYTGPPTAAQIESLIQLSVYVHQQCKNISHTIGHRDVSDIQHDPSVATACPGDMLYTQLPSIKAKVWDLLHPHFV